MLLLIIVLPMSDTTDLWDACWTETTTWQSPAHGIPSLANTRFNSSHFLLLKVSLNKIWRLKINCLSASKWVLRTETTCLCFYLERPFSRVEHAVLSSILHVGLRQGCGVSLFSFLCSLHFLPISLPLLYHSSISSPTVWGLLSDIEMW